MLSEIPAVTPRPLPPAKARRLATMPLSNMVPPPPYVSLDAIEDTVSLAGQLGLSPDQDVSSDSAAEDWMNEKSREELSDLLLKADGLIRSRQSELSLTSALCKSLYQDNVTLKSKHEALLARLPASRSTTPAPSMPSSPLLSPNVYQPTLQLNGHSFFQPPDDVSTPVISRARHARKISVTPSEIAQLADQNAELLEQLERLEAESLQADQAGKRRLRKLEKEIQGLRQELESTQAKSEELEAQAKAALDMSPQDAQRRREEREERIRMLKEKAAPVAADSTNEEVRDFAPASELSWTSPLKIYSPSVLHGRSPSADGSIFAGDVGINLNLSKDADVDEEPETDAAPPSGRALSQPEMAIISQLLIKIQELEEINAQIKSEQRLTSERLRTAQWDAESIRRIYDCLDDLGDGELQIVSDDEPGAIDEPCASVEGDVIKLSHLRRSLDDLSLSYEAEDDEDVFRGGITKGMHSTTRSAVDSHRGFQNRKLRKPVMGLFSLPDADTPGASTSGSPSLLSSRAISPSELGDVSTWSVAATDGITASSPALSVTPMESPGFALGPSLGSELGSEFGDDWGTSAGYQHLRTSSLYDLAQLNFAHDPGSTSPDERPPFVFPTPDSPSPAQDSSSVSGRTAGSSTPTRSRTPTLKVEPPTPSPDKLRAQSRSHRLSQTMHARTHRWVEGRFPQAQVEEKNAKVLRPRRGARRGTDATVVMDDTFGEVVQHVRSFSSRGALSFAALSSGAEECEPEEDSEADGTVMMQANASTELQPAPDAGKPRSRREGLVGVMVELWLWLQFAVVILVFLWAMAKRGPKSVLREAERRAQQGTAVRRPA
ncbi:hypothetical protein OBBRIDRAFT_558995 [Obba rivulosa]|uniref:Uncharacterized protein n=1 Tax=Obba rivulosa TaxID=1052685 RepID=A0A8E2AU06_9APHY|nr:hypothetical protein OBBRIDRAFT_558995 [Obba rivulosa]